MQPSIRKPIGILAMLVGLAVYGGLIARYADDLAALPKAAQAVIYLILGLAWLLPLRPLLVWMNK